jgi:hypothetical protein
MKQIEIDEELIERLRDYWSKLNPGYTPDSAILDVVIREWITLDSSPILRLASFWGRWISPFGWIRRISFWWQVKQLKDFASRIKP